MCYSVTCLTCLAVSLILSLNYFLFPSLLAAWGTDVPFSFEHSWKTCFCKCPFPQLSSRKAEIKNNFLSIPDATYTPGGKCAYPI